MQDLRLRHNNPSDTNRFGFHSSAAAKRPASAQSNKEFVREALEVHNELRRKHSVEPLRLNNDLSKLAQEWGN
jgi:uncharacterized protein YkwD